MTAPDHAVKPARRQRSNSADADTLSPSERLLLHYFRTMHPSRHDAALLLVGHAARNFPAEHAKQPAVGIRLATVGGRSVA